MSVELASRGVERLKDSRDIVDVLRGSRQRSGALCVVTHRHLDEGADVRVAVIASRKVGNAVRRNRAKRLLREAARHVAWRPGTDVVLVARRDCADAGLWSVLTEVRELAEHLDAIEVSP